MARGGRCDILRGATDFTLDDPRPADHAPGQPAHQRRRPEACSAFPKQGLQQHPALRQHHRRHDTNRGVHEALQPGAGEGGAIWSASLGSAKRVNVGAPVPVTAADGAHMAPKLLINAQRPERCGWRSVHRGRRVDAYAVIGPRTPGSPEGQYLPRPSVGSLASRASTPPSSTSGAERHGLAAAALDVVPGRRQPQARPGSAPPPPIDQLLEEGQAVQDPGDCVPVAARSSRSKGGAADHQLSIRRPLPRAVPFEEGARGLAQARGRRDPGRAQGALGQLDPAPEGFGVDRPHQRGDQPKASLNRDLSRPRLRLWKRLQRAVRGRARARGCSTPTRT